MIIAIGSTNPIKVQAVKTATEGKIVNVKVVGVDVESGVSAQPMSDEESQKGAENRARAALLAVKDADLGIGLEGGVQQTKHGLLNSVWCCVVDREDRSFFVNGERFYIPKIIADKLLAGGELGPVLDEMTGEQDVKKARGFIGVVTRGYLDRAEAYGHIAKMTIGLWYGAEWQKDLK